MAYERHSALGLAPAVNEISDYASRRKGEGADETTIIAELVSGKGPCASSTGILSCTAADVSAAVYAAKPRSRGRSVLLWGALAAAGVLAYQRWGKR